MRTVLPLQNGWQFARLPQPAAAPPAAQTLAWQSVALPHIWNRDDPAAAGCVCYRCEFAADPAWQGGCAYLAFDAVCGAARVFLNGRLLGEHRGSYARFVLPAPLAARNVLEILADNTRYEDINPLTGDFTYWGGVARPVSLLVLPAAHFDPSHYGAPGLAILHAGADGVLRVSARPKNAAGCTVRYTVTDADGVPVAEAEAPAEAPAAALAVAAPRLWNGLADPYLYRCTARLLRGGAVLDEEGLAFGFRDIALDAEKGFLLNGRPLRLNGVARHHDREGAACALTDEQIRQDFAILRDIGANAVRLSHYQHPQLVYDLCDQAGLAAWAEIPMLAMPQGNTAVYENARAQLTELILQNRHHPAICFWGVQNEIAMMGEYLGMYAQIKALHALAKSLDPDRLTGAANLYSVKNNSQLNFLTDAVGYNIYFGWYYGELADYAPFFAKFHAENPGVPLGVTEYGVDCNPQYHSDAPECKDYTEEFQCLFHEKAYAAMQADRRLWGTFVWNLFDFSSAIRDEGGVKARNLKGLVSWDRSLKKDAYYYYKARWSAAPFVHLCGRRYQNRCAQTVTVKAYSNQPAVALYVNGRLFAETAGQNGVFAFAGVPLGADTCLEARAVSARDSMVLHRVSEPDARYTYPKKGQGNRVTNWFRQQPAEVDLFPAGRYSISDKMGDLLANQETAAVLQEMLPAIAGDPRARKMGGMTLMRILDYNADAVSEEQALAVNARLNRIEK